MRKRINRVWVHLSQEEYAHFLYCVRISGYKKEPYLRALINGYVPRAQPPMEYRELLRELHAIGNNLNQIAVRVNSYGIIDSAAYQENVQKFQELTMSIHLAVTQPDRI